MNQSLGKNEKKLTPNRPLAKPHELSSAWTRKKFNSKEALRKYLKTRHETALYKLPKCERERRH